jgi:type IV pilus assembly protein PilB
MGQVSFQVLDGIGQQLVDQGMINADQLAVAQETQRNLGGDLAHILIKKGFVTEDQILEFLGQRLGIPFISLKEYAIDPSVTKFVPVGVAKKYRFMPIFKIEDTLTIAMADPLDVYALDEIRDTLKCNLQPVLAAAAEIDQLIEASYRLGTAAEKALQGVEIIQFGAENVENEADRLREMASGARIVAEVDRMIRGAAAEGASDIHIEPQAAALKVRNRVDGVLEERMSLGKQLHLPIITRIKIIAGMDIAERRVPQDGRVRVRVHGQMLDMRVSTYPTMFGEKVVIRLFSKGQLLDLTSLGFEEAERETFEQIIAQPHGIFLVTGPTGSGKTTTLYAALSRINSQDRNIVSIEDPIENEVVGINQAQVNLKAGLTFASALRSILRQDPDVIMVGEIRDRETADIAVRAAITGHLVFSTIHTNTAIGAVTRLTDLGVEPFLIASALIGVMSQRLVRCVCPQCQAPTRDDEVKLSLLGLPADTPIARGTGCKNCRMSGYAGRTGLFEIVPIDRALRSMIVARKPEDELAAYVRSKGILDLRSRGRSLVLEGKTTVDDVLRVTEERN